MAKLSSTQVYGNLSVDGKIINPELDLDRTHLCTATASATNVYVLTSKSGSFALVEGAAAKFKVPSNSTGACTANVDGSGAKAIKKSNGNDANNLKAGSMVTIVYNGSVFTLQGEGGSGNATAADILTGKTATTDAGDVAGAMANRGAVTSSLNAGGNYVIPQGYHNGSGKVTANSLASQTQATATAPWILSGQTAWVNGVKLTGAMPDISGSSPITHESNNATKVVKADGLFIGNNTDGVRRVSLRYNGANGFISGNTLFGLPESQVASSLGITSDKILQDREIAGIRGSATSDANATASDIVAGCTAYVRGVKLTGTAPKYNSGEYSNLSGSQYKIYIGNLTTDTSGYYTFTANFYDPNTRVSYYFTYAYNTATRAIFEGSTRTFAVGSDAIERSRDGLYLTLKFDRSVTGKLKWRFWDTTY